MSSTRNRNTNPQFWGSGRWGDPPRSAQPQQRTPNNTSFWSGPVPLQSSSHYGDGEGHTYPRADPNSRSHQMQRPNHAGFPHSNPPPAPTSSQSFATASSLSGWGSTFETASPYRSRQAVIPYGNDVVRGMVGLKHLTESIVDAPSAVLSLENSIRVTDEINAHKAPAADTVLFVVYVRLKEKESAEKIMLSLDLMDVCVKNCGLVFAKHINSNLMMRMARLLRLTTFDKSISARVTKQVNKLLAPGQAPLGVPTDARIHAIRRKVLTLIQNWSDAFMSNQESCAPIHEAYRSMRASGVAFPPRDNRQRFLVKNAEDSPAFDPVIAMGALSDNEIHSCRGRLVRMKNTQSHRTLAEDAKAMEILQPRVTAAVEQLTSDDRTMAHHAARVGELLDLNDEIANALKEARRALSSSGTSSSLEESHSDHLEGKTSSGTKVKLPRRRGSGGKGDGPSQRQEEGELSPVSRILNELKVQEGEDGSTIPSLPPPSGSQWSPPSLCDLTVNDSLLFLGDSDDGSDTAGTQPTHFTHSSETTQHTSQPSGPPPPPHSSNLPKEMIPDDLDFFFGSSPQPNFPDAHSMGLASTSNSSRDGGNLSGGTATADATVGFKTNPWGASAPNSGQTPPSSNLTQYPVQQSSLYDDPFSHLTQMTAEELAGEMRVASVSSLPTAGTSSTIPPRHPPHSPLGSLDNLNGSPPPTRDNLISASHSPAALGGALITPSPRAVGELSEGPGWGCGDGDADLKNRGQGESQFDRLQSSQSDSFEAFVAPLSGPTSTGSY
eukprot:GHVN01004201.1.p1 GENE.GHVN01004201.1~~GHVN01004201.1.p1  ORF type:complete len:779 (+),score=185.59 GHVN01004201.1:191-2527(+)